MKKQILSILVGTLGISNLFAQSTNTTISLPLITITGVSTNVATTVNDLSTWVSPLLPYLTNQAITCDIAPVYGQGKFGGLGDLRVYTTSNLLDLSLGVGGAYINTSWYVAPVSAKIGTTITVPIINKPVYMFAEEGLCLRPRDTSLGSQTVVGGVMSFVLSTTISMNIEGGLLKLTQETGNDYFAGFAFTYHPKHW